MSVAHKKEEHIDVEVVPGGDDNEVDEVVPGDAISSSLSVMALFPFKPWKTTAWVKNHLL